MIHYRQIKKGEFMHIFDYFKAPEKLLTPEITALVAAIREFKGKQELYLNVKRDVLQALMEVAKIQSTTSSNRIEGISTTDVRMRELMSQKTIPRNRNEQGSTSGWTTASAPDSKRGLKDSFRYISSPVPMGVVVLLASRTY